MHYSLLSRFQGTLVGAALGEILGTYAQTRLPVQRSRLNLAAGQWIVQPLSASSGWGRVAVADARCLIDGSEAVMSAAPRPTETAGLAIAALPIALLFHESPEKLRDHLGKLVTRWGGTSDLYSSVLTVGYAIALALQERLHPPHLIPQLLSDLDLPTRCPSLAKQLLQVQAGIEQHIGLSAAMGTRSASLGQTGADLSIAFYCFLSTPEDYSLTIRRCANSVTHAGLSDAIGTATAIAGALSGVYNSRAGIPLDWRRLLNCSTRESPLVPLWNLDSADQIDSIASEMLALWSGMYQPSNADPAAPMVSDSAGVAAQYRALPIAAPGVIRPR